MEKGLDALSKQVVALATTRAKRVVFTAITGNYDQGYPLGIRERNTDYILFHDGDAREIHGWVLIRIPFKYRSDQRTAKIIKILPHLFLSCYSESIWIDGNFIIQKPIWPLVNSSCTDLALFSQHPRLLKSGVA